MIKTIEKEKDLLKQSLSQIQKHLAKLPTASLHVSRSHNSIQYYINGKYIKKSQRFMAEQAALRDYYISLSKIIENQLQAIENLLKVFKNNSIDSLYDKICPGRQLLLSESIVQSISQKILNFESQPCPTASLYPIDSNIYTNKGEHVRSKSEKIIADELFRLGVPYKYELSLTLSRGNRNITIHPDFTVMNKRSGKIMYIEHLGLMDDINYSSNALDKISLFEQNGLLLGIDLLIFHETRRNELDTRIVKKYLEEYLT